MNENHMNLNTHLNKNSISNNFSIKSKSTDYFNDFRFTNGINVNNLDFISSLQIYNSKETKISSSNK